MALSTTILPTLLVGNLNHTSLAFWDSMFELSCTVKSKIGFLKTCYKIWLVHAIFNIFLRFSTNFHFQGCHIWAVWLIWNYMATLKMKSDLILLLRKLKNPWIWILFFRVAKIWQSGLPYLWRIWRYDFKINVRWWAKYQLKLPCIQILWGNSSRIMHSQTPCDSPGDTLYFSQIHVGSTYLL